VVSMKSDLGPALVTGAARRLGRAIAEGLARAGRPVVLHASPRSLDEAARAAQALCESGARAAAIGADLADPGETETIVKRAAALFGTPTLLVNNASLFEADASESFELGLFERHMAVNLRAPLLLSRDFAAGLPQDQEGAIINVLDQCVLRPTPKFFTYTLAKSALWTATRTMAQAFAPKIRVNAIGPGPVLANDTLGQEDFAIEVAGVPLQRAVDVEEIVAAALYLAAARNVTGQMIAVDSGQHLAWKTPDIAG